MSSLSPSLSSPPSLSLFHTHTQHVPLSLCQTYIGSILVSVNPYKMFNIYGTDHVLKYEGKALGENPPWVSYWLQVWSGGRFTPSCRNGDSFIILGLIIGDILSPGGHEDVLMSFCGPGKADRVLPETSELWMNNVSVASEPSHPSKLESSRGFATTIHIILVLCCLWLALGIQNS